MKKLLQLFAVLLVSLNIEAQTIYAVCFADTIDNSIGKSCKIDADRFYNQISILRQNLGYRVVFKIYEGNDCKATNLYSCLNNLNTTADDIIIFHYAGHGGRSSIDPTDKFPQMDMYNEPPENFVPIKKVRSILAAKTSRLRIIVADCCNKEGAWYHSSNRLFSRGQTIIKDKSNENLKKLFLGFKGEVVMSGCKAGQTSGGDNTDGGLCTYEYFTALQMVANGALAPNWESVCKKTQENVSMASFNQQVPEYEINAQGGYNSPTPPPSPIYDVFPNNQFADAIKFLIDKNKSVDSRLAQVNSVFNNYFTSDAKVVTIGADLKTVVDEYNIKDYLDGICLSPNLLQINILGETNGYGGKKQAIIVHEIRYYRN